MASYCTELKLILYTHRSVKIYIIELVLFYCVGEVCRTASGEGESEERLFPPNRQELVKAVVHGTLD